MKKNKKQGKWTEEGEKRRRNGRRRREMDEEAMKCFFYSTLILFFFYLLFSIYPTILLFFVTLPFSSYFSTSSSFSSSSSSPQSIKFWRLNDTSNSYCCDVHDWNQIFISREAPSSRPPRQVKQIVKVDWVIAFFLLFPLIVCDGTANFWVGGASAFLQVHRCY